MNAMSLMEDVGKLMPWISGQSPEPKVPTPADRREHFAVVPRYLYTEPPRSMSRARQCHISNSQLAKVVKDDQCCVGVQQQWTTSIDQVLHPTGKSLLHAHALYERSADEL